MPRRPLGGWPVPADVALPTGRAGRLAVSRRYPIEVVAVGLIVAGAVGLSRGPAAAGVAGGLAVLAVVVTALAHEGAHAVAAVLLGVRVHTLTLRGALTASIRRDRVRPGPSAARIEVLICLAGPAASLALLVAATVTLMTGVTGSAAVTAWCVFGANLIAVGGSLPGVSSTDGSRALRAWRNRRTP